MTDHRPFAGTDRPEPGSPISRRGFARVLGAGAVAGTLVPRISQAATAFRPSSGDAETVVKQFHDTLKGDLKAKICLPWSDPRRTRINANWAITEPTIDDFSTEQQALTDAILKGVTSPEGYERFQKQMDDDDGGIGRYHVALFGEPGTDHFEWVLTGRHLTIRADGDTTEGAAFGGPIIYGHGVGDGQKGLPGNVFYYQTKKANEVFTALDGKQRDKALIAKAPAEARVPVQGEKGDFPGLAVAEMSSDQKALVESVMKTMLGAYREKDVDEALSVMKSGGGMDALRMAFFESDDLGGDHEWDLWRIEGPTFVWHFRGAPHVHSYVNVARKA